LAKGLSEQLDLPPIVVLICVILANM